MVRRHTCVFHSATLFFEQLQCSRDDTNTHVTLAITSLTEVEAYGVVLDPAPLAAAVGEHEAAIVALDASRKSSNESSCSTERAKTLQRRRSKRLE